MAASHVSSYPGRPCSASAPPTSPWCCSPRGSWTSSGSRSSSGGGGAQAVPARPRGGAVASRFAFSSARGRARPLREHAGFRRILRPGVPWRRSCRAERKKRGRILQELSQTLRLVLQFAFRIATDAAANLFSKSPFGQIIEFFVQFFRNYEKDPRVRVFSHFAARCLPAFTVRLRIRGIARRCAR